MCHPPLDHRSRSDYFQVARPLNQRCPLDTQSKTLVRFSLTHPILFLQFTKVLISLPLQKLLILQVLYVLTHQLRVTILARMQFFLTWQFSHYQVRLHKHNMHQLPKSQVCHKPHNFKQIHHTRKNRCHQTRLQKSHHCHR